ncbi:MAG: aKG-HExxH-type peptide beta-hydroxylase [Polyangiaceae bacterium]
MAAPLECPKDLTVPGEGSTTSRAILSKALGRACRELPLVVRALGTGPLRDDAAAVERALLPLLRESPAAVASLLRHPHLSTLVRTLRSSSGVEAAGVRPLGTELLALVAFDLAWRGALPSPVTLRRLPRRLVSRAARVAVDLPPGVSAATFQNGKVSAELTGSTEVLDLAAVEAGAGHPWVSRPYRDVRGDIVLALADNNPLSSVEAHPDKKTPNTVDLGGHPEEEWIASLRGALALIEKYLPAMSADVDVVLQQIVPTGFDAEKHLSCSYQEDIGTIYLSLHPSPLTMAEAIIHEVSHNKLNALFDVDPIIENGRDELYTSPIRPDPRPIHGVLLAVHAFVPVACMYESMTARSPVPAGGAGGDAGPSAGDVDVRRIAERYAAVVRTNRAGTGVLEAHARPTRIGKGLLDELFAWGRHFRQAG